MKHNTPKTTSIEKALDLLMAFTPNNREMGNGDLSQELGLHPATINRILKILTQKHFLQQNSQTRKFKLGLSAFQIGRTIFQTLNDNVFHTALPHLHDLCEQVNETVVLEILSEKKSIVAYVEQGKRGNSIGPKVGDIVPNHAAAAAKAIIAFTESQPVESFLEEPLQAFTEKTITDREVLKKELAEVRVNGVAFCREEMEIGLNAIGAPIFDHTGKPVAGILIAGLTGRVKCDIHSELVTMLKKTASTISEELFHRQ